jgi:hypothetical protein
MFRLEFPKVQLIDVSGREANVPVIVRSLDQIIDLGIYQFEDPLFSSLFVAPEFFRGIKNNWASSRCRRPSRDEQLLKLGAGYFEVLEVDKDLDYLAEILGG